MPTATPSHTPVVPALTACSPCHGPSDGGWTLTLTGSGFLPGAQITLDGVPYTATWAGPGQLELVLPALPAGNVAVGVVNPSGAASATTLDVVITGPAATATRTPGPSAADGPLEFLDHRAWPNPVRPGRPAFVSVLLKGRADSLSLRVYTRAWVLVAEASGGPQGPGWVRISLPPDFLDAAGSGAYFYVVSASRGEGKVLKPAKGTLQLLR